MFRFARLALLVTFVAGCGSGGAPAPTSAAPVDPTAVAIQGFAFAPATLQVAKGTRVTWTNKDSTAHTVTANDKRFDSGNLAKDATFSVSFGDAVTVDYACLIHGTMKGQIVVK